MKLTAVVVTVICATLAVPCAIHAADKPQDRVRSAVDRAVLPMMAKDAIPGLAIGITVAGKHRVFNYGAASKEPHRPVTDNTLFELGSVTKTFTATLASWAEVNNRLSLSDTVGKYLPVLRGTPFGNVTLLNLGTHTPGGLPLQVPDGIRNEDQLMEYFKAWRPTYAPGTYRTYSNPGIGTLGLIVAKCIGQGFDALMQQHLFPALGMTSSYINVPAAKMDDYAEGYTNQGAPIRMAPGVLSSEAYGMKSTAADMLRFLDANLGLAKLDPRLQRAIRNTHIGYFHAGPLIQDLIWEQYSYPVALSTLREGNSREMVLHATPATAIKPRQEPREDVWINKTGSTSGFGAYMAFVPEKRLGVVILANKSFPNEDRVTIAYRIMAALAAEK